MTFEPVVAWWVFLLLAGLTLVLRMFTLYRVLVVVGGVTAACTAAAR